MIYTLTANPAVDLNETCGVVKPNSVIRTRDAVFTPNGKGLNVSFTLKHFGCDTSILGFFAGFTGDYIISGAEQWGVHVIPVHCKGITRVNLFLSTSSSAEYKFVNAGTTIDAAEESQMIEILENIKNLDCLVVSGSLPPGTSNNFLSRVIDTVKLRGGEVVLDISSLQLRTLIGKGLLLIKPNDDELRDIFNIDVKDDKSAKYAMQYLHQHGAKNVLLTLGASGAYFSNGESIWRAKNTLPISVLSSACAGDGTLGSFLSVWFNDQTAIEEALVLCQAVGSNIVESPGLGNFSHVEKYKKYIQIDRL
ncbi:MAG: 1-phosphofructokinase [Coriobacteriaceae bacterium]|uniref:1-phosphofructokinase family hexose kinase n=1 Tax=Atopobium sp. oral taxon 416 TaxID=712157 RepID=UPI000FF03560|nr:hexose kinase [Atopobium sp. oral taxon 416]QUC04095.1 hexose kinase [Atopobium sp. oral taxon 416]RRF99496.1 MAG: 1-phosphofructokinase [Coriobacteriaceae bacterium]